MALGAALNPESPARLMSQAALAGIVGVKQPSVSAWVAMTARPEVHYRRAIRRAIAEAAAAKGLDTDIAEDDWMTDAERTIANGTPKAPDSSPALAAEGSGSHEAVANDASKSTGTDSG